MHLIALLFSGLMFLLFVLSLRVPRYASISSELVTLGVLGTFMGVFVGLYHFDFNAIEASIPELLDGLKMAFVTSIIGLSLYVALMVIKSVQSKEEDGAQNFLNQQVQMLAMLEAGFKQMDANAQCSQSKQERLISTLDEALSKIAKNSQQEAVKALAEVVKDFNAQLNTQFGDNFRELNESVKGINTWQKNYQSQVSAMETSVQALLQEMNQTAKALNQQSSTAKALLSKVDVAADEMNGRLQTNVRVVQESLDLLLRKANARY